MLPLLLRRHRCMPWCWRHLAADHAVCCLPMQEAASGGSGPRSAAACGSQRRQLAWGSKLLGSS